MCMVVCIIPIRSAVAKAQEEARLVRRCRAQAWNILPAELIKAITQVTQTFKKNFKTCMYDFNLQ